MEDQRAQPAIITSLYKTKEFDKIKTTKGGQRHDLRKSQTHAKIPARQSCSYYGSSHPHRQCPAYEEKCVDFGKVNHFREVCRSGRNRTVHDLEQEPDQHQEEEDLTDMVTILILLFSNSKQSVITANLKNIIKPSFNNSTI